MDRRTLLKTGAMAALGGGLGACAKSPEPPPSPGDGPRPRPALGLVPVNASWDRVIHTTVGLRPFRASGFVVKPERVDWKTVIHNYGHGGGGMSLTWGTSYLAAEMAIAHRERRVAVIGCGAAGLTSARQLQRRGFDVTIYAKNVPPHTTSNMSWAGWTPTSRIISFNRRSPLWDEQFRAAADEAFRELQLLAGRDYGVTWLDGYGIMDEVPPERMDSERSLLPPHLRQGREILGPGEHPFPSRFATRERSMQIEPAIYLDRLVRDVLLFGGRIEIRAFESRRELMSLPENLIVNCTGLGARELFDDDELTPIKGQLTLLIPQEDVDYKTFGGVTTGGAESASLHMTPRRDGIALGGTGERGEWSLEPNPEARQRVVDGHIELYRAMRRPWRG